MNESKSQKEIASTFEPPLEPLIGAAARLLEATLPEPKTAKERRRCRAQVMLARDDFEDAVAAFKAHIRNAIAEPRESMASNSSPQRAKGGDTT